MSIAAAVEQEPSPTHPRIHSGTIRSRPEVPVLQDERRNCLSHVSTAAFMPQEASLAHPVEGLQASTAGHAGCIYNL